MDTKFRDKKFREISQQKITFVLREIVILCIPRNFCPDPRRIEKIKSAVVSKSNKEVRSGIFI
jgi:hypothetical protein